MVTEKFSGKIDSYQGQPVSPAIEYAGEFEKFTSISEVKEAGEWPNDADILEMVNKRRLTAAKAKVYQEKTKDLKEKYESSDEFKIKNAVAALVKAGFDPTEAEAIAKSKL